MRSIRATIVAVEKQWVLPIISASVCVCVCVCVLCYPACNAHAPYYLWPVPLYNIFPHYLSTIFEETLLNTKCVFWFSLQLLFETFLSLRRTEKDMIKNVYRSSHKEPQLFLSDFKETLIFLTGFQKILQVQNFMKIRPVGAELLHADRQKWRSWQLLFAVFWKRLTMLQKKDAEKLKRRFSFGITSYLKNVPFIR